MSQHVSGSEGPSGHELWALLPPGAFKLCSEPGENSQRPGLLIGPCCKSLASLACGEPWKVFTPEQLGMLLKDQWPRHDGTPQAQGGHGGRGAHASALPLWGCDRGQPLARPGTFVCEVECPPYLPGLLEGE